MVVVRLNVLSCKQPWGELVASGRKDLEIRSRATHHRGPLAIHASARPDDSPAATAALELAGYLSAKALPLGRIVAVTDLKDCWPFGKEDAGRACTPWSPGLWAWHLAGTRRADSEPVKGRLGIWQIPDSAVTVREATS